MTSDLKVAGEEYREDCVVKEVQHAHDASRDNRWLLDQLIGYERLLCKLSIPDQEGNEEHTSENKHRDEVRIAPRCAVARPSQRERNEEQSKTGDQ